MSIEHLDIYSEHFDDIVEDIKQRNLSRNNMAQNHSRYRTFIGLWCTWNERIGGASVKEV